MPKTTNCPPSPLSATSSTTQTAKKTVKSAKKAAKSVKRSADATSRPSKKRRKSSGMSSSDESVGGNSRMCFFLLLHLPMLIYIYFTVNDQNSTREPSVIEIEEDGVGETPEEELSECHPSFFLAGADVLVLQNACRKLGAHLYMASSSAISRSEPRRIENIIFSSVPPNAAKTRVEEFAVIKTLKIVLLPRT